MDIHGVRPTLREHRRGGGELDGQRFVTLDLMGERGEVLAVVPLDNDTARSVARDLQDLANEAEPLSLPEV